MLAYEEGQGWEDSTARLQEASRQHRADVALMRESTRLLHVEYDSVKREASRRNAVFAQAWWQLRRDQQRTHSQQVQSRREGKISTQSPDAVESAKREKARRRGLNAARWKLATRFAALSSLQRRVSSFRVAFQRIQKELGVRTVEELADVVARLRDKVGPAARG